MSRWMQYRLKADFNTIGSRYNISDVIARIIFNRGIHNDRDFNMYVNGSMKDLHDPHLLKDANKAVDILKEKIKAHRRIRIIGDYDIDGICSTYILYKGLITAGAQADYAIPHRINDGYGINIELIDEAVRDGIDTIITCDNGISAYDEIKYAEDCGITVIVTDHHQIPVETVKGENVFKVPMAHAVINPHQPDCKYPYKELCGAGVAYKLITLLFMSLGLDMAHLEEYAEFAAIATVGDLVELKDENRIIVKYGLKHIAGTKNIGLRALIETCGIDINNLSAYHVGFVFGPCLNASGRLSSATDALEMLLSTDKNESIKKAQSLKALNEERKELTEQGSNEGLSLVENTDLKNDKVLVVYLPDVHESIAGLIAGRIKEVYYKPTIVLTKGKEGVKGSARSIEGYDIAAELGKCKCLLTKFGGHPMAAGLSLPEENIEMLRKKLNENITLKEEDFIPKIWIDDDSATAYSDMKFISQLEILEPYGVGNSKPFFAARNMLVKMVRMVGRNHNVMHINLEDEYGKQVKGVIFNATQAEMMEIGSTIQVVYYPSLNQYMGNVSIDMIIKEWRRQ